MGAHVRVRTRVKGGRKNKYKKIVKYNNNMSTMQAVASNRFLTAMGSMIEDAAAMDRVLSYIAWMKQPVNTPQITMYELEKNGMPLPKP